MKINALRYITCNYYIIQRTFSRKENPLSKENKNKATSH